MTSKPASQSKSSAQTKKQQTTKKVVKHSRKFERTQTGCLQCRQKKKKCDGKRPACLSCTKRGATCQYPANIRFFTFEKNEHNTQNNSKPSGKVTESKSTSEAVTSDRISTNEDNNNGQQIDFVFQNKVLFESNSEGTSKQIDPTITTTIIPDVESIQTSRSSSIYSILSDTSFSSQLYSEEEEGHSENYHLDPFLIELQCEATPRTPNPSAFERALAMKESIYKKNEEEMEDALNLVNDGESISKILNNITIDLITKSIQNLSYINLEEKLNNYYSKQRSLTNAIQSPMITNEAILRDDAFINSHIGASNVFSVHHFDPVFDF